MKKLRLFGLVIAIGLFFTAGMFPENETSTSQTGSIEGVVLDKSSGDPLPFANVSLLKESVTIDGVKTDQDGAFKFDNLSPGNYSLKVEYTAYQSQNKSGVLVKSDETTTLEIELEAENIELSEFVIVEECESAPAKEIKSSAMRVRASNIQTMQNSSVYYDHDAHFIQHNTEEYDVINENVFKKPTQAPLSTFSIDVDNASYSNVRRMLNHGQLPQKDVVRIEEMINYFTYDYKNPEGEHPFSINTEISDAPWNKEHKLVHVGIQGKKLNLDELAPSNLVFLIDVSGSMNTPNRLPLVKSSLKLLLNELDDDDRVSIVVYASASGMVLPSTPVSQKQKIIKAIDNLQAGGSTAGGAGIQLAYKIAKENYIEGGNNRVVLATDGDFNVGVSSTASLVEMIKEKQKDDIYLTIGGFGMGNYKDGRMEQISNAGNGNYYYIDNIQEAKKVFVTEMRATLFTIAKDVKIQVEFNPEKVEAYRLIGYENRKLRDEDFNDDKVDAGELGAGHTVTALYEIIPKGVESEFIRDVDELKYQKKTETANTSDFTDEMMTIKFRYKRPDEDKSRLIVHALKDEHTPLKKTSNNFRFSASVAGFGMLLRNSEFKGNLTYNDVMQLAKESKGNDSEGYRAEFIKMVESSKLMAAE